MDENILVSTATSESTERQSKRELRQNREESPRRTKTEQRHRKEDTGQKGKATKSTQSASKAGYAEARDGLRLSACGDAK
jgi:hypothetical protein